jgi:hypothetical protein
LDRKITNELADDPVFSSTDRRDFLQKEKITLAGQINGLAGVRDEKDKIIDPKVLEVRKNA